MILNNPQNARNVISEFQKLYDNKEANVDQFSIQALHRANDYISTKLQHEHLLPTIQRQLIKKKAQAVKTTGEKVSIVLSVAGLASKLWKVLRHMFSNS